jgi:hypothetical protein
VKLTDRSSVSSPPAVPSKIIPFADLRLPKPLAVHTKVLIEYEDHRGGRSYHQVSLTCTGQGGGLLYFGGFDAGKFSIFRADCIHRVISL